MPHTLLGLDFDQNLAMTYQFVIPAWGNFMAEWLTSHGHYPTTEEARTAMQVGENPYGCGPTFLAKKLNHNQAWIEAFYQSVAPLALAACRQGGLKLAEGLKDELARVTRQGYQPVVISQGHRDFILPMLHDLGLANLIPPTMVVDRAHKRLSAHGYQLAKHLTQHLGLKHRIMTDDAITNFPLARAEGFQTVLIKPDATPAEQQEADATFPDLLTYLQTL